MTWFCDSLGGGETLDALIEGIDGTGNNPILGSGWNIITSPVKNGTGAIRIPAGNAAYKTLLGNVGSTEILCLEAWVNFDGNPAVVYPGLMQVENATYDKGYYLQVGTDRRVRIWGDLTTHIGPLTPWSEGVLGNGAWTHLVWFLDPLTLGTNNTWLTVVIDDVVQLQADVGAWPYWLGGGATSSAKLNGYAAVAVDVRLDDIAGLRSTDKADAPHLAAAPIVKVAAQHPNADTGCSLTWTRYTGTNAWYTYWDEATGNDGDTTYLGGGQDLLQTSLFESSATLGWGGSAVVLESAAGVGPVWSAVYRSVAAGTKWSYYTYCDLAGNEDLIDPGTTYAGKVRRLTRTSGTWAPADLGTLKAGALGGATVDRSCAITTLMLQWAYYDTTLALTPAPMIPQSCLF